MSIVWIGLSPEDYDFVMKFDPATELDRGQGAGPADLTLSLYNYVQTIRDLISGGREVW